MIKKIYNSQLLAYIIFLAVLIIPNILLCFTEGYPFLTMVASLLIPLGVYIFMLTLTRKPGVMALIMFPFMFLGAFQLVLLYLFGESIIAVDMFTNLFTTNASEAGELLGNLTPSIIAVCVIYLPAIALAIRSCAIKTIMKPTLRKTLAAVGVAVIFLGFVFGMSARYTGRHFAFTDEVFPANACQNLRISIQRLNKSLKYKETSQGFTFGASREKPDSAGREIYIMVVGEASRADNWSLFGYGRKTTPVLDTLRGVIPVSMMISQSNATHKSVPLILSAASAENYEHIYRRKSVLTAFKEAGFTTAFISNHVPNRSLIDYFSHEADFYYNISPIKNELYSENFPDGMMIPVVDSLINCTGEDLFLVLHMYGSHFRYTKRYPEGFARFLPDNITSIKVESKEALVNAYDNSIAYTDYVMGEIISILSSSGDCTALFYMSDHGEDLLDDPRDRFLHSSPNPTYYQIHPACFMWLSPQYRAMHPGKAANAGRNGSVQATAACSFHTMVDIAGITTPYLRRDHSMADAAYSFPVRYYLNDRDLPVLFQNAGLKRYDIEKFKEKGMWIE